VITRLRAVRGGRPEQLCEDASRRAQPFQLIVVAEQAGILSGFGNEDCQLSPRLVASTPLRHPQTGQGCAAADDSFHAFLSVPSLSPLPGFVLFDSRGIRGWEACGGYAFGGDQIDNLSLPPNLEKSRAMIRLEICQQDPAKLENVSRHRPRNRDAAATIERGKARRVPPSVRLHLAKGRIEWLVPSCAHHPVDRPVRMEDRGRHA